VEDLPTMAGAGNLVTGRCLRGRGSESDQRFDANELSESAVILWVCNRNWMRFGQAATRARRHFVWLRPGVWMSGLRV